MLKLAQILLILIKKYKQLALLAGLMITVPSCTSKIEMVSPTQKVLDSQETKFKQLYLGQSFSDVQFILQNKLFLKFEVQDSNINYSYYYFSNHDTKTSLYLYFIDKKLTSVLIESQASALWACKTPFRTNNNHWLSKGIKRYSDWIISNNSLNSTFDYRAHKLSQAPKNKTLSIIEHTFHFAVWSPLIVIGSPFILYDWLSGNRAKEQAETAEQRQLAKAATTVKIGDEYKYVTKLLKQPDLLSVSHRIKKAEYENLYYSFGFDMDDKVTWIESTSFAKLKKIQFEVAESIYADYNCVGLEEQWLNYSLMSD